ncbi:MULTISPECIES: 3-oxoacyl-ACP synthase III family protein [Rufibacter]|uniref:3-oxoacyl-[acyl-carrier-protein] synthase-3 n=1 Tax=Rufibacter quisquiliarum TaxID=1549639 RepID=A0A839GVT9_9BACT|nr:MULTISPECIES: ketoacyl-ACP synthase III [Rufibacter]MBA9079585.1 3-oxoacyl-[acyl-carrier-protein] synthase-3 [Rufibacter quisquiliarum]
MHTKFVSSVITGSGRFVPSHSIKNEEFLQHSFYDASGKPLPSDNETIIRKFHQITGIRERRYADEQMVTSDLGYLAARDAIQNANIEPETLDYIIVAHNFGDVKAGSHRVDMMPPLASRIKHKLQIANPYTVAYDLPFGCPGWLQGLIQAHYYLQSGDARRVLVIGAETLSRVTDPHDRDSMIYSDGAGAVVLEAVETESKVGILGHLTVSDTVTQAFWLHSSPSYNPALLQEDLYIKMDGRKIYEYALTRVPQLMKDCLTKAGVDLEDLQKLLIHQANEKMDEAMLERLFKLYGKSAAEIPAGIMPMTINTLGNNSVATLPILYDLLLKGELEAQSLVSGAPLAFASVGAGMNANSVIYLVP